MPLTNAERKKKYVEKLKSNGLYDAYKKKKNERERNKRQSLKEGLCKLPKATREKMLKIKRENCRERVKICRMKKAAANQDQALLNGAAGEPGYRTASALNKAAAKTKKTLPSSRTKQIELLAKLVNSFNDDEKQQILKNDLQVRMKVKRGINPALITAIQNFYMRDDISRQSPNVKDTRYFINPITGERELMTKRHLLHKLSDVYDLFIKDYYSNITDQSKPPKPPVKLAKFCALRPAHVKLVGDTPHEMCFCIYHTNFIECCETIHKHLPEFPKYNKNEGKDLFNLILCPNETPNCWLRKCTKCTSDKIKKTMEDMLQRSGKEKNEVKWIQWKKDADANRYYKSEEKGTLKDATEHFINMCPSFLPHRYVKRIQANTFQNDNKLLQSNPDEAVLQIDFAESFPCEAQDEIQVAHWNQRNISLFTSGLKYSNTQLPNVIASDNTDHSKDTVVAYVYKMLKKLPKNTKTVKIWSDGPRQQFKNKYIAAIIKLLEKLFGIKIVWNFFATAHGKSFIDGLGATAKKKVKSLVLRREAIVNCAADFVEAFNKESSLIHLIEMTSVDIHKINTELKVFDIFDNAKAINNISTFHQLQVINDKVVGFTTSVEGYRYFKNNV